jgi:peptide/nickel transport system substrate-binding protein/oligopeptide transport system substrate-binding protein
LQEGYKETGIKSIKVTLLASDDDSSKQTAEFLQSQLDRLPNVNISVQNIPFTQLISRQTAGNYEITIKNWQACFLVIQLTSWMFSKKDQVISTTLEQQPIQ